MALIKRLVPDVRRGGGELPGRGDGPAGALLRDAGGAQSQAGLRGHPRLRRSAHRRQPLRRLAGLRRGRPGHGRHDGDHRPGRRPRRSRSGLASATPCRRSTPALGIVSAVLHARETGEGQFLDVAMADAVLGVCERIVHQHSFGHLTPGPEGNHHPFLLPFGIYPAADGFVALACPSDHFFRGLVAALGARATCSTTRASPRPRRGPTNRAAVIERLSAPDQPPHQGGAAGAAGRRRAVRAGDEHRGDRPTTRISRRAACWPRSSCQGLPEPMRIAGQPIKFARTPAGVTPPRARTSARTPPPCCAEHGVSRRRDRALARGRRDRGDKPMTTRPDAPAPLAAFRARASARR